jgi:hypothetical protein
MFLFETMSPPTVSTFLTRYVFSFVKEPKSGFRIEGLGLRAILIVCLMEACINILRMLHTYSLKETLIRISTWYSDSAMIGVRFPVGEEFPLCHNVQTGSGAQKTPYPMGTGVFF